jgi:hypothetical protein
VLRERGRCVRENVRAKEEWLNPSRAQGWDSSKLRDAVRYAYERGLRSMLIAAIGDEGNRARVLGAIRVNVNPRV